MNVAVLLEDSARRAGGRGRLVSSSDSEARSLLYSPHRSAFRTQTAGRKFAFVDPGPSLAEPVIEAGFGLVAQYALRFGR